MIRLTLLWLLVSGILVYSWKDWYRGLCALIVLMAVMEHPDMPKTIFGIQGLNPFNLLLGNVCCAWLVSRKQEGVVWDLPPHVSGFLLLFLTIVLIGVGRMMADSSLVLAYYQTSPGSLLSDYLVNTIKWVIPGLLLFDGCRSEERFRLGIASLLAVYVFLGLQVIKWMPPQYAIDPEELAQRSLKVLVKEVGYHRVNLSAMLAGASWAIVASRVLVPPPRRVWIFLLALTLVYAQAMTAGRTGYATWGFVGLTLTVLKWRRFLPAVPLLVALVIWFAPGVTGRMSEGFSEETHDNNVRIERAAGPQADAAVDAYTVTAGRSFIWPFVMAKISERMWTGYGRQAMLTTGLAGDIKETYNEGFPHPHNAYLEFTLDNGILGFGPILVFYLTILWQSIALFLDDRAATFVAIGGVTTAFVLALLIAATGSQSFYPVEGWMCMWCAIGLMWRVRVQRRTALKRAVINGRACVDPPVPARSVPRLTPRVRLHASTVASGMDAQPRFATSRAERVRQRLESQPQRRSRYPLAPSDPLHEARTGTAAVPSLDARYWDARAAAPGGTDLILWGAT